MSYFIDLRGDGSEKVKYDYDGYYSYIRKGMLSDCQNYSADSHWHDDLEFIQKNNANKITLDEIAKSGNVSKSTCLVIFKKYLQDTPANYLISYRLKNATNLLQKSDLTITEIAFNVGFSGASYFSETFKKIYGCSPSEYKEKF